MERMKLGARRGRWMDALLAFLLPACGGDGTPAVPIQSIPPDKKLVDLSPGEQEGVCQWGESVASAKLPAPGTTLNCHGLQVTFNGATGCNETPAACPATVAQWQTCLPHFIDRIAQDPCQILDLAFGDQLSAFVDATSGCEGLGACSFTIE